MSVTPAVLRSLGPCGLADSDGDGVSDAQEAIDGTNPNSEDSFKDSDNDGMPDAWEIKNGLNPKDANDASKDRNKDGYTNIEEYLNSVVSVKNVKP